MHVTRRSGEEAQVVDQEGHVRTKADVLVGFAGVLGLHPSKLLAARLEQIRHAQKGARAFGRSLPRPAPVVECGFRRPDRLVHILAAGINDLGDVRTRGRILNLHPPPTLPFSPAPLPPPTGPAPPAPPVKRAPSGRAPVLHRLPNLTTADHGDHVRNPLMVW